MSSYHGIKPVTDDDKKMATKHLKATLKLKADTRDLLKDKIADHKKALADAVKAGDKKSAAYNRSHMEGHESEDDRTKKDEGEIYRSLDTLKNLHTHSRRVYNDVRKAKVNLMYKRAAVAKGA